jgi:hypothetical protein
VQNFLNYEHGEDVDGPRLPGSTAPGGTPLWVSEADLAAFIEEYCDGIEDAVERKKESVAL